MKRILLILAALLPIAASAATLVVQWVDPTPTGPAYVPGYEAEYRINGGAATSISGLTNPVVTQTISAVSDDTVQVRYRAVNNVVPGSPIAGAWTTWYAATQAVSPLNQNAPTYILFAY